MSGFNIALGATPVSCGVTAVAAVLALLVVRRLTAAQEECLNAVANGTFVRSAPARRRRCGRADHTSAAAAGIPPRQAGPRDVNSPVFR